MSHDQPTSPGPLRDLLRSLGFEELPPAEDSLWVSDHDRLNIRVELRRRGTGRYRIELEKGVAENDSIRQAAIDVACWGADDTFKLYADPGGDDIQHNAAALTEHAERLTILATLANFQDADPLLPVWVVTARGVESPLVFESCDQAAWHLATAIKEEAGTGCEITVECVTMTRAEIDNLKDA